MIPKVLSLLILNLMPDKVQTQGQWLALFKALKIEVSITWLYTASYKSKHTPQAYLESHYKTFEAVKGYKYDGMIVTGAPVESLDFEAVKYWEELIEIMDYARVHYKSSLFVCWAAQAALYHHYGLEKRCHKKYFGIKKQRILDKNHPILKGIKGDVYMPHSRYSSSLEIQDPSFKVLLKDKHHGLTMGISEDGKVFCITGHYEYEEDTLMKEYERDFKKGLLDTYEDPYEKVLIQNDWQDQGRQIIKNWLINYL